MKGQDWSKVSSAPRLLRRECRPGQGRAHSVANDALEAKGCTLFGTHRILMSLLAKLITITTSVVFCFLKALLRLRWFKGYRAKAVLVGSTKVPRALDPPPQDVEPSLDNCGFHS